MRVLVFGITDNPGGVEAVIMNYYRYVDNKKIQFDFLCNTKIVAYEDEIKELGGNIYRIPMRSKNMTAYKTQLRHFFDSHIGVFDAIWVNVCSLANIDYLKEAKRIGIPTRIIHSHNSKNMDSWARGILHGLNKQRIKNYATQFWACSQEAGKWFFPNSILKGKDYHIIHNAIDIKKYEFNLKIRDGVREQQNWSKKFVIGNVGRLHFQKNQSFLLETFSKVNKVYPQSILVLVGDGEDKNELQKKASILGISDSVFFLGLRSDIPALLQGFDVFVFPSVFEGLPLAVIEAEAASLPVIASQGAIPPEVNMSDNFSFLPLESGSDVWAKKILGFINSARIKQDLSRIIESGFDIESEIDKFSTLLEMINE